MAKTFWNVEKARKYAKKIGGRVYNNPAGYINPKVGHLIVKRKKNNN